MAFRVQILHRESAISTTVTAVTDYQLQAPGLLSDEETTLVAGGGLFGNILGSVAPPLGGAVGRSGVGQSLGGSAGSLGQLLPF
jgi:hypothetical protein